MLFVFHETLYSLFGCVICLAQAFPLLQVPPSEVKVEFRLAEIAPGPGLRAANVDGPLQMVYLHKGAIIRNKDIVWARAGEEPNMFGQYEVTVRFTQKAAKRMATATETKRGLLAILIDGKVIAAMGIPTQIYDKANISGPMTKLEAENLAAKLNKKSRARRLIIS